jgi:hypothetical protein
MTTHERQPETFGAAQPAERTEYSESAPPTEQFENRQEPLEGPGERATQPPLETQPPVDQPPLETQPPVDQREPASAAGSGGQTLFADGELSDLRSRWTEVQSAFVDDPRECVQKADGLVADVVDRLTAGFSHTRSGLEEQWSRGEQASTEDLRIALQQYRDFFERLLAV